MDCAPKDRACSHRSSSRVFGLLMNQNCTSRRSRDQTKRGARRTWLRPASLLGPSSLERNGVIANPLVLTWRGTGARRFRRFRFAVFALRWAGLVLIPRPIVLPVELLLELAHSLLIKLDFRWHR